MVTNDVFSAKQILAGKKGTGLGADFIYETVLVIKRFYRGVQITAVFELKSRRIFRLVVCIVRGLLLLCTEIPYGNGGLIWKLLALTSFEII